MGSFIDGLKNVLASFAISWLNYKINNLNQKIDKAQTKLKQKTEQLDNEIWRDL